jgi:hypothetical protein
MFMILTVYLIIDIKMRIYPAMTVFQPLKPPHYNYTPAVSLLSDKQAKGIRI